MTTFGESAGRLAGCAGTILGWSPDAFWRATPAELTAVVRAASGTCGDGGAAAMAPPDAATIATMREAFPDG